MLNKRRDKHCIHTSCWGLRSNSRPLTRFVARELYGLRVRATNNEYLVTGCLPFAGMFMWFAWRHNSFHFEETLVACPGRFGRRR